MAEAAEMESGAGLSRSTNPRTLPTSRSSGEIMPAEEEQESPRAPDTLPTSSLRVERGSSLKSIVQAMAEAEEMESGAGLSRSMNPRPLPTSRRSGEIMPAEEEQDSPRAPDALPTSSSLRVERGGCTEAEPGRQQHAHGRLDVELGDVSTNLPTVTSANNWTHLCGILLAMCSRDIEVSHFTWTEQVNGCEHDRYCLGAESALRVSLAFFAFFAIMFIATVLPIVQECRNFWNSNLGVPLLVKVALVVACMYLAHLIASPSIEFYGSVARFGAWLFLAIQLISVTRFIMWLNKWHQSNPERRSACRRLLVKATAVILNFGSFGVTFWLLHEHRSNIVDFTIIGITLVLIILMICIYLKSEVTAGWLAHGLMIAYVVFMCWTVIKSEPHRNFTKAEHPKGADWLTITSFVFVVIVTAYSTVSTGEDHEWIQFNVEVQSEDDIHYGYGYFHLVFALGSMYFGMLLVGWNAHQTMERWTVDFGWWSAVVRAVNGFLAAMLYIWMLRTPFIWNKRKLVVSWPGGSFVPHVRFL